MLCKALTLNDSIDRDHIFSTLRFHHVRLLVLGCYALLEHQPLLDPLPIILSPV